MCNLTLSKSNITANTFCFSNTTLQTTNIRLTDEKIWLFSNFKRKFYKNVYNIINGYTHYMQDTQKPMDYKHQSA